MAKEQHGTVVKVKCVYNSRFAKLLNVWGITLYPFIFMALSREQAFKEHLVQHEFVHVRQVRKHGWFKFYINYLYQYFANRLKGLGADKSYSNIDWEKEAYAQQKDKNFFTEEELKETL